MDTDKDEIHLSREEARAGSTPGIARYVLAISLVLVIIAFAVIVKRVDAQTRAKTGINELLRD